MKRSGPRRRITTAAGAAITAAVLVLAGCSAGEPGGAPGETSAPGARGGVITGALGGDPQNLDITLNAGALTIAAANGIFEGLFALDESFVPQPMLAEGYELSEDGLTYTIRLREGIPFHNGDTLEASDVVASLERWMEVSAIGIGAASDVDSVEATDASTVVITLVRPRYSLIADLAWYVQQAAIVPADIAEAAGGTPYTPEQVIGTGPYMLEEYVAGQRVDLVRFEDYQARDEDFGGYGGAKHAYADEIDFVFVPDAAQRLNGLRTGQWDWVQSISADDLESAADDPALTVVPAATYLVNTVLLNHNVESAFASIEARQALNALLDKPAIAAATFGPPWVWEPLTSSFAGPNNASMFSDVGREVWEIHDPELAAELFDTAGIDGSEPIRILTSQTYPQFYQWAIMIQQALTDIGVPAEIESYDYRLFGHPVGVSV